MSNEKRANEISEEKKYNGAKKNRDLNENSIKFHEKCRIIDSTQNLVEGL